MDIERASAELKVIRELMERPVCYSTMSGASGVLAGVAALGGVMADWVTSDHHSTWLAFCIWGCVFMIALVSDIALTRIREKKQGMPFWTSVKRRMLLTILPPFVAGVGLTAAIVVPWQDTLGGQHINLIPALWMAFYGLALWQAGEFSIPEIRVMGAGFILASLPTAMFLQDWPYCALAITFGGFHLAYGVVVWLRHGG
jgi:hypothetical protein